MANCGIKFHDYILERQFATSKMEQRHTDTLHTYTINYMKCMRVLYLIPMPNIISRLISIMSQ